MLTWVDKSGAEVTSGTSCVQQYKVLGTVHSLEWAKNFSFCPSAPMTRDGLQVGKANMRWDRNLAYAEAQRQKWTAPLSSGTSQRCFIASTNRIQYPDIDVTSYL